MLKRATGFPVTNNQLVYPKLGVAEFHKGIDPKNFRYETVYLSFELIPRILNMRLYTCHLK